MTCGRIAINGFGRVGRAAFRALAESPRDDLEVVALNARGPARTAAHLLKYDSTHGTLPRAVEAEDDAIIVEGRRCAYLTAEDPADIDWGGLGVDVVLECTGKRTGREAASVHLAGGAKRVLISAPGKDSDHTVVFGVNHAALRPEHRVVSCGSCTTNCLAPVAMVLHRELGIECGWMNTIHAFTKDQSLLDTRHSDLRRARAATESIIPTKTGAADAIGLVLPELKGRLSGIAVRVPTKNVSLVDLTVLLGREAGPDAINAAFRQAADGELKGVLVCNTEPLVSVDFNHHPASAILDETQTRVTRGRLAKVLAWYDNEWGFSNRMLDVAALLCKLGG